MPNFKNPAIQEFAQQKPSLRFASGEDALASLNYLMMNSPLRAKLEGDSLIFETATDLNFAIKIIDPFGFKTVGSL